MPPENIRNNNPLEEKVDKKSSDFSHNVVNAVRKTIAKVLIATGVATGTLAGLTTSTALLGTLTTSCEKIDKEKPTLNIKMREVDVTGGKTIRISNNQLKIGNDIVAEWSDNETLNCLVTLTLNGKSIISGNTVKEAGNMTITIKDMAQNDISGTIKLDVVNNAPSINVIKSEVDVSSGKTVTINNNKLSIGDEVVAEWSDDNTKDCTVSLTLDGKQVKSGDTLKNKGTLTLKVTDEEGKYSSADIKLDVVNNAPSINVIKSEVDLSSGKTVTINNNKLSIGDEVVAEWSDDRTEDCKVSLKFNGKTINSGYKLNEKGELELMVDDNEGESSSEKISITKESQEFVAPTFEMADPINKYYSWYNNLSEKRQEFIHDHILISYLASEWYKQDNLEYIIVGEVPAETPCENVGDKSSDYIMTHADDGLHHILTLTPTATVKACGGSRPEVEEYVNNNPNKYFMLSCSADYLGADDVEDLRNNPKYKAMKRLLENDHVVISTASLNITGSVIKILSENVPRQFGGSMASASVTSKNDNKFTYVGFDPYWPNVLGDDNDSRAPIGFGEGNEVIPFIPLVSRGDNYQLSETFSSYPNQAGSSNMGNSLSIIMGNHDGSTLSGAATIMTNNYFTKETYNFKDNDGTIKEGGKRNIQNTKKFIEEEGVFKSAIEKIQFNSDDIELPSPDGICYVGKGFQFECDGKRYDNNKTNEAILKNAIKSGKNIKRYWNKESFLKQGGQSTIKFDVYRLNRSAEKIPDLHITITKTIN